MTDFLLGAWLKGVAWLVEQETLKVERVRRAREERQVLLSLVVPHLEDWDIQEALDSHSVQVGDFGGYFVV